MKQDVKSNMIRKESELEEGFESAESDNNSAESFSEEDENVSDNHENKIKHNPGWADAMAKILRTNKPKRKKTIVLSKAKKLKPSVDEDVNGDEKETFTIEASQPQKSDTVKTEEESVSSKPSSVEQSRKNVDRIRKKDRDSKGRIKPSVLDKDREKVLCRIATRGVVQLFNAVREQQKTIEKKIKSAGPSDSKQEKVLKSVNKTEFLNVLMKPTKSQLVPPKVEERAVDESQWSVLRDDFMMSTKLKDWDKGETT